MLKILNKIRENCCNFYLFIKILKISLHKNKYENIFMYKL